MAPLVILPDKSEALASDKKLYEVMAVVEFQPLGYLSEHIAVVHLVGVHPCRLPEVELQHLENLRIREPGSCPGGEKLALGDDVDAGGEWLDGEVACIASCVVCHYNSEFYD